MPLLMALKAFFYAKHIAIKYFLIVWIILKVYIECLKEGKEER